MKSHMTTHANHGQRSLNLRKETAKHTLRCLLGCNVGEMTGITAGHFLGLDIMTTLVLAVSLAFTTGYAFTIIPMVKTLPLKKAVKVALVGDTASISAMEIAENSIAFLIPGFMGAALLSMTFFAGMAIMLVAGFAASYPIMYYAMRKAVQEGKKPSCH